MPETLWLLSKTQIQNSINHISMKSKKKIWFIVGGIVLVIILLVVLRKQGVMGSNDELKVTAEKVKARDIIESVTASGKIQPEVEIKISPYISGEVVKIYVKEGDRVKAGDLLAEIDPEIYKSSFEQSIAALNGQKANLANAKAALAQAKAQFSNAKTSFERNQKLFQQNAISASEFDAAKASYEVAKAQVDASDQGVLAASFSVQSSEQSLRQAKENLTRTTLRAPADGTISKLSVEKGERVTGASQFSSGTEIMRIANLNNMEVNVDVNENDIIRLSLNDTAIVEVDAYTNRKFKGVVTEIANSPKSSLTQTSDQVTNFNVKVRILQESYQDLINPATPHISPFRPGMSASVEILTKNATDVLTVPIQAVTTRSDTSGKVSNLTQKKEMEDPDRPVNEDADKKENAKAKKEKFEEYVFVIEKNIAVMRKVKTGIQDNNYIEIKEGLKDGEQIVSGPYTAVSKTLKNRQKIKVVSKTEIYKDKE